MKQKKIKNYLVIPSSAEETYLELQGNFERLSDKLLLFRISRLDLRNRYAIVPSTSVGMTQ